MENNDLRASASVRRATASVGQYDDEDLNEEQALGTDQVLKLTALLYFKEALVDQKYESCQELVDTAKNLGASPGDISAVITDYLNGNNPVRQKTNRLRSY